MARPESTPRISSGFAFFLALGFASCAHAETFRCGSKLVLQGDTRMEVRHKCGEPGDVEHSTLIRRSSIADQQRVTYREEETVVSVEVWTYNLGSHRFMYRLRFVDGILEGVETRGYGYDDKDVP